MSQQTPVNVPASIRQRLFNFARAHGQIFQDTLVRFGTERLLYRLSKSPQADRFILKGATLFAAWGGAPHRATRDADLLGFGDPSAALLAQVFRDLTALDTEKVDGLRFDPESVRVAEIREETEYGGLRVNLRASLDGADVPLQVDVGFGDAVDPAPEEVELPVILPLPAPRLRTYPREVVVAEKFEAMVKRGVATSRLKDYYDLWFLVTRYQCDAARLRRAVAATFERRGTAVPDRTPESLSDAFAADANRVAMWERFLEQARVPAQERPTLAQVVTVIRPVLVSIAEAVRSRIHA